MKSIDITGQTFGRLTAIKKVYTKNNKQYWLFKCSCGNEKVINKNHVREGSINSCGCLLKENNTGYKHGLSKTRLYSIFMGMKNRCYNPNEPAFKNYGQRGIFVCKEWLNNPKAFVEWALSNGYNDNLTIERIDVNKGYCPENCTWIPLEKQVRNTRVNRRITYKGITKCLAEWCETLGLNQRRTEDRLLRGWSIDRAFSTKEPLKYWIRRS